MVALNQPSHVPKRILTNQVDTGVNKDYYLQYFQTLEKNTVLLKYMIQILKIHRLILKPIHVYANGFLRLQQHHGNYLHMENSIFVFKLTENLPMQYSMTNQEHRLK